jgi:APA family basic amino acid/polyamine antiporter
MKILSKQLGLADAIFLVIGSVFGSGIFLTSGIISEYLRSPWWLIIVWILGGILTLVGALTYAELGAAFPSAGGPYVYLREAYGFGAAFLYGWTFFWIIGGAGIAALAMGFAESLSSIVGVFSTGHILFRVNFGFASFSFSAGHAVAITSIGIFSFLNGRGVKTGARAQNFLTVFRIAAIAGFALLGIAIGKKAGQPGTLPLFSAGVIPSWTQLGAALVAVLWTYDGWYSVNCTAEEVRNPDKTIPLALALGTLAVAALYLVANIVYIIALPMNRMRGVVRIGEMAAGQLFGGQGALVFSAVIAAAVLGCLSANILFCPRVSFSMARDGLFFRSLAFVHPRHGVPARAIWAQMIWASLLCLAGSYRGLFELVVFALLLFFAATGLSLIVLRAKKAGLDRPYLVPGYPAIPILYILANGAILVSVLASRPLQSAAGAALILAGWPAYLFWKSRLRSMAGAGGAR